MSAFECLLAAALLTAPPGVHDIPGAHRLSAAVRPALQKLAVRLEILDPREVRYVLARPEDLPSDLKLLQRRFHDLHAAPPLGDCLRFPDRSLVNDLLTFNRAYR